MTTAADGPAPAANAETAPADEQSATQPIPDTRPDEPTHQSGAAADARSAPGTDVAGQGVAPPIAGGVPTLPPPVQSSVFDGQSVAHEDRQRTPLISGLRRPRERRRARRVIRVIRRIDLWSVLKLALVLYTCLYAATLAALVAIWGVAYSTGLVEKLQSFLGDVGLDNFRFYGDQMFRACAAIGAVLVLAGTLITVLTVALINLISELTGGIRIVIIEEEPWPSKPDRVAVAEVEPLPSDPAAGL